MGSFLLCNWADPKGKCNVCGSDLIFLWRACGEGESRLFSCRLWQPHLVGGSTGKRSKQAIQLPSWTMFFFFGFLLVRLNEHQLGERALTGGMSSLALVLQQRKLCFMTNSCSVHPTEIFRWAHDTVTATLFTSAMCGLSLRKPTSIWSFQSATGVSVSLWPSPIPFGCENLCPKTNKHSAARQANLLVLISLLWWKRNKLKLNKGHSEADTYCINNIQEGMYRFATSKKVATRPSGNMRGGVTVICVSQWYVFPRTHIPRDMCFPHKMAVNVLRFPHPPPRVFLWESRKCEMKIKMG